MAMLQRERKPSNTAAEIEETEDSSSPKLEQDFITNDPVLESLSNEPMEYEANSCCLSPQVVESLQSVKHICLSVLDLLLLQIVKNLPHKHARRLSDPSAVLQQPVSKNLLGSITQNTNLLQELSTPMTRSKSSPPATSISDVYRILDSQPQRQSNAQDYTLCCSLAALLNDVYRLLELNSTTQKELPKSEEQQQQEEEDIHLLQLELHDQVSIFQRKRAAGIMSIDESDASQEMMILWDEMDHLMNIVSRLAIQQQQPPAYGDHDKLPLLTDTRSASPLPSVFPPAYDSIAHQRFVPEKEKKSDVVSPSSPGDLDQLLDAIDRLSCVAPRLNNQRVNLTEKQVSELAAATLGKTVERLSRGRMENQRAPLPKHQVLQDLVQQIQKSASRSLDNQRVTVSTQQQKKMDFASIRGILHKLDRGRYSDQDWMSREEILLNDLKNTTDLLVKSLDRPAYNRQRFSLSAAKERNLFMTGLFNKVENLEGYRLANQDAELTCKQENDDLQELLNRIYKSSKPQLDNQRASFTL